MSADELPSALAKSFLRGGKENGPNAQRSWLRAILRSTLSPKFLHHNQTKLNDPPVLGVLFAVRISHLTGVCRELP
jgi:hypothetical protein